MKTELASLQETNVNNNDHRLYFTGHVSFDVPRLSNPITSPSDETCFRTRQTINEFFRNTLSASRHLKTPHVFGKRLLGAHQMAGRVFLLTAKKVRVTVTTPVSFKGYVVRHHKRNLCTVNDTGIVILTECRVVNYE